MHCGFVHACAMAGDTDISNVADAATAAIATTFSVGRVCIIALKCIWWVFALWRVRGCVYWSLCLSMASHCGVYYSSLSESRQISKGAGGVCECLLFEAPLGASLVLLAIPFSLCNCFSFSTFKHLAPC